jgi:hypothetical protein
MEDVYWLTLDRVRQLLARLKTPAGRVARG